jgi:hypothetical protein
LCSGSSRQQFMQRTAPVRSSGPFFPLVGWASAPQISGLYGYSGSSIEIAFRSHNEFSPHACGLRNGCALAERGIVFASNRAGGQNGSHEKRRNKKTHKAEARAIAASAFILGRPTRGSPEAHRNFAFVPFRNGNSRAGAATGPAEFPCLGCARPATC